jgi:hypothetical protein
MLTFVMVAQLGPSAPRCKAPVLAFNDWAWEANRETSDGPENFNDWLLAFRKNTEES